MSTRESSVRTPCLCCHCFAGSRDGAARPRQGSSDAAAQDPALAKLREALAALTRNKDSIVSTAMAAAAAANSGNGRTARAVIRIVLQTLEREGDSQRRVNLFFLVDAMLNVSLPLLPC